MKAWTVLLCLSIFAAITLEQEDPLKDPSGCYDDAGRAQRCMPEFVNAAFRVPVDASNTCGITTETEYCLQTGVTGARKLCYICDARRDGLNHPPEFMTDFNKEDNLTWWQSDTMQEGVQYPNTVNITLHLKKAFDITYVRIRFRSPRPESFAIYKRTEAGGPWIPYQFYSASCESTYGLPRRGVITRTNETVAICTEEFSGIAPLTGGSVAFSTLEGRPSAFEFSQSPELQEWVTATDVKIVLTRMNTFGDEVFGDPRVLKSYFYAISDLAVGARCKCNGHGSQCQVIGDQNLEERLRCNCQHFTNGPDCGQCLPFYKHRPWARATQTEANECQRCIAGRYGPECDQTCGMCWNNASCNYSNGHCRNGCVPGYKSPLCKERCDKGTYGEYCVHNCSQGCQGTHPGRPECHHATGHCSCLPGWDPTDPFCGTGCKPGLFGQNCSSSCGSCREKAACHHVTGLCPHGCQEGFHGPLCKDTEDTSGTNVIPIVVGVVAAVLVLSAVAVAACCVVRYKRRTAKAKRVDQPLYT